MWSYFVDSLTFFALFCQIRVELFYFFKKKIVSNIYLFNFA